MSHDGLHVQLRDLAADLAAEAADLARAMRPGIRVSDTKSSPVDVVTEADRAVETWLRGQLATRRPDDAVLGEEGEDRPGTSGVRWVLDPIDGTVNYLYGLPECAVSVAAEVDGETVAGAVVAIESGVTWQAARGAGATRGGTPLAVREVAPVAERLVLTGFSYDARVRAHQAESVARLLPRVRDVRRMGSCALDLCHVAEGTADGYVEEGPQRWDWAAASLVAAEAGARFARLPGVVSDHLAHLGTTVPAPPDWPDSSVITAAPAGGWEEWLALLREAGFTA